MLEERVPYVEEHLQNPPKFAYAAVWGAAEKELVSRRAVARPKHNDVSVAEACGRAAQQSTVDRAAEHGAEVLQHEALLRGVVFYDGVPRVNCQALHANTPQILMG